ncbi:FecR family protein [Dysgonomonas sp. Marseille-P4677]|uniref:FecR family protein n=1 Tax=Dysgonomonas sp. Marseille-P4677 TaxID=2364790 RepID=UPI001911C39A|nr:FecR family protein [Dysgonomonas sp. Marseille-P4677]MBK5723115.1 FecR family protein [Dysgonomonas sp. Marseille-P4677]
MNQEFDKNIFYKFFSRDISIEEEKQLLDWIDESADNKSIFLSERELYNQLILNTDEKRLEGLIEEEKQRTSRRIPMWVKEVLKVSAVILLVLGGMYFFNQQKYNNLTALSNEISIPAGEKVSLTLSDGTKVWVNAKSKFTYPSLFGEKERRVFLDGEAFFDVKSNAKIPFIVETSKGQIKVLGTEFNVDAYSQSSRISVSLFKGKVEITGAMAPKPVVLSPNEYFESVNNISKIGEFENNSAALWKDGLIAFKDTPFLELMKTFEKYYDVKIEILNTKLSDIELTGKIRINDGIEHALKVIQKNANFSFQRDSDESNIIYIR